MFLYLYKGIISESKNKPEYSKSLSLPYVIIKNLYPKSLLNKLKYFTFFQSRRLIPCFKEYP